MAMTSGARRPKAATPSLETELRQAIDRQELQVEYQPVVALRSGAVVGAEALVRWRHPARGTVAPDQFLPLAEESGLITAIGAFVLGRACKQARSWQLASPAGADFVVSVNVSARELADPALEDLVLGSLATAGLRADSLVLEIGSGVRDAGGGLGSTDDSGSITVLAGLQKLGVRVALDDFGSRDSFRDARRLSLDMVKLDPAFVVDAAGRPADAAFVEALLAVARARGLVTVAKGVETQGQARRLLALGCDQAQGFLYSKPLGAEGIGAVLARGRLGTLSRHS